MVKSMIDFTNIQATSLLFRAIARRIKNVIAAALKAGVAKAELWLD